MIHEKNTQILNISIIIIKLSSEFSPAKIAKSCTPASADNNKEKPPKGWNWHTGVSTINLNTAIEEPAREMSITKGPADRNLNCNGLLFFSILSDRQQQANK